MSSNFDVIIFITARLFHYTLYCEHCPPTHHNQKPIGSLHFHFHRSNVFCLFFFFERKSGLPRFSSKVCRTFRIVIIIKEASFFFLCVWACAVITRIPGHPLPPPPYFPPPTHSPSLINLMASVDVKHHVTYLLTYPWGAVNSPVIRPTTCASGLLPSPHRADRKPPVLWSSRPLHAWLLFAEDGVLGHEL